MRYFLFSEFYFSPYRGIEPRCRSFPILAYDLMGGPGGSSGLGPDRPGPHGPGGKPPLGSFPGLRSRTLISFLAFFVLSCMFPFIAWLFLLCEGCWPFLPSINVLRKTLRSLTRK